MNAIPEFSEIINGEVEFYTHCYIRSGLKMCYWEKAGNISNVGRMDHIMFRDSEDYGNPEVKVSDKWWVWKINQEQKRVGKLIEEFQKAEIGFVFDPESIVLRIKTGEYGIGNYPRF